MECAQCAKFCPDKLSHSRGIYIVAMTLPRFFACPGQCFPRSIHHWNRN